MILVFTLEEAPSFFMELVFGQQCQGALPHWASSMRSGRQKHLHLHCCVDMLVLQNSDLQCERALLQLINRFTGFQTLTHSNQTCKGERSLGSVSCALCHYYHVSCLANLSARRGMHWMDVWPAGLSLKFSSVSTMSRSLSQSSSGKHSGMSLNSVSG